MDSTWRWTSNLHLTTPPSISSRRPAAQCQRVLAISLEKTTHPILGYPTDIELADVLAALTFATDEDERQPTCIGGAHRAACTACLCFPFSGTNPSNAVPENRIRSVSQVRTGN